MHDRLVLLYYTEHKLSESITLISIRNPSNGLYGLWMMRWKFSCWISSSSYSSICSRAFSCPRGLSRRLPTNCALDTLNSSTLQAKNVHVSLEKGKKPKKQTIDICSIHSSICSEYSENRVKLTIFCLYSYLSSQIFFLGFFWDFTNTKIIPLIFHLIE